MITDAERDALAQAYFDGLLKAAADSGMEKEAFWGALASIGEGILNLGRLGRTVGGAATRFAAKPFEWAGRAGDFGLKRVLKPETYGKVQPWLSKTFAGSARDMGTFGLLGGGINALMAEPGERGSAFLSGFGTSALGGLGWRVGSNLTQQALQRTRIPSLAKMQTTPEMSPMQRLKIRGARMASSAWGLPLVGGMAGSMALDPSMYGSGQTMQAATPQNWTAPAQSWAGHGAAW